MDRTVPRTGSEEIELYIRTYYSLLRSSAEAQLRTLEETHAAMGSSLHPGAHNPQPDMAAFVYSSLRLPECILEVERVILGQTEAVFQLNGFGDVGAWRPVAARARRRRCYFDGHDTLACLIASGTDIDDIIPILTAFQIEWNKLKARLQGEQVRAFLDASQDDEEGIATLAVGIGIGLEDLSRLRQVWGDHFWSLMRAIAAGSKRLCVGLVAG